MSVYVCHSNLSILGRGAFVILQLSGVFFYFFHTRMYDNIEHSTSILLYLEYVCLGWPYTFDLVPKAFFVCELCRQRKKLDH